MVAFPVAKLAALVIKQVSKPLANAAKARAKQSPFFRNYICMPPAQFYHWWDVKLKMYTMNLGKPVTVPKLNEASAIDLGAELVGEAVIFSIAAAILIFEYVRQNRKEAVKEADRIEQFEQINRDLKALYAEKARQDAQIDELVRILGVKMPDVKFTPIPVKQEDITVPQHQTTPDDLGNGVYSTVKGWVFNAIDFVLPPTETSESEPEAKLVVVPSGSADKCKCDDETSNNNNTVSPKR